MTAATILQRRNESTPVADRLTLQQLLLASGVLSAFLYAAMNIVVPLVSPGYSVTSQTISELSAIGAPTRSLWFWQGVAYTVLAVAFGSGVLRAAGAIPRLRVAGLALLCFGLLGVLWPFAPMHQRAVLAAGGGTVSDTMHIALSFASVLLMTVAVVAAAIALGGKFRLYSLVTMLVVIGFGTLTGMGAPAINANLPTPLIGVWERVSIGAFLLWEIVLAALLLPYSASGGDGAARRV